MQSTDHPFLRGGVGPCCADAAPHGRLRIAQCLRVLVSHGADLRLRLPRARASLFHLGAHVAELIGDDPEQPLVDVDGEAGDATKAPEALEEHPVVRYLPLGRRARARLSAIAAALLQREKECLVRERLREGRSPV